MVSIAKYFQSKAHSSIYDSIFTEMICKPFYQILLNSHHSDENILEIYNKITFEKNYNAKTRQYENFIETGIVDPLKVVTGGLTNAVSIALTILSTECLIVDVPHNDQ